METLKKILKFPFGQWKNINLKSASTFFILGMVFMFLGSMIGTWEDKQAQNMMLVFSSINFAFFLIGIDGPDTGMRIVFNLVAFMFFTAGVLFPLNFFLNKAPYIVGWQLIWKSIISAAALSVATLYWISKAIDLIRVVKDLIIKLKKILFSHNGREEVTIFGKIKSLLENATAFLLALAGFGIAAKGVLLPVLHFFSKYIWE